MIDRFRSNRAVPTIGTLSATLGPALFANVTTQQSVGPPLGLVRVPPVSTPHGCDYRSW